MLGAAGHTCRRAERAEELCGDGSGAEEQIWIWMRLDVSYLWFRADELANAVVLMPNLTAACVCVESVLGFGFTSVFVNHF